MSEVTQASLDRREKKYQTLVALIEKWQRKLEKADKTVHKAVRTIAALERQRSKMRRAIERAKLELPRVSSDPERSEPPISSEPEAVSEPQAESEPGSPSVPKRHRKKPNGHGQPKAGDPGPELAEMPPPITPEDRAAHMAAAGFRKVTRKR